MRLIIAPVFAALMVLTTPSVHVGDITISAVTSKTDTDTVHFEGTHPRFLGIGDTDAQKRINARMAEWEQEALARAKAAAVTMPTGDRPEQRKVEGVFGYEVKRNGGGIVSLLFDDYLYSGGANGLDTKTGYTFYTDNGETITLPMLFKNSDNGIKLINQEICRQLKERNLESQLLCSFRGINSRQPFYLTDSSLVIVVRELTWFPHAMGTVEFEIPFTQLQDCLNDGIAP